MKKLFLSFFCLCLLLPGAAFARDARVVEAEQWLNNLTTAQARFEQRGYDGSILRGDFYLSRPGRLRFAYDSPVRDFVVADGTFIHFYDAQQRQTSSTPVGATLADFLLRPRIRLDGDLKVTALRDTKGGVLAISLVQSADPAAGTLELRFTKNPFQLASWKIVDGQGLATEVILTGFRAGVPTPPALFVYKDPTGRSRLND